MKRTEDTDEDGYNELMLKVETSETTGGTNTYLMYQVEDKKMKVKKAEAVDWPTSGQWVTNNVLTEDVITSCIFTYNEDTTLVTFKIQMANDKADRKLEGQVVPRVY